MITITVQVLPGNVANITVDPTLAYFSRGDLVQWFLANSNGTNLKISFKNSSSPFDTMTLTGGTTLERGVLSTAALQSYHYSVVATVGGVDYTIPGCPEIIIQ